MFKYKLEKPARKKALEISKLLRIPLATAKDKHNGFGGYTHGGRRIECYFSEYFQKWIVKLNCTCPNCGNYA